jgi:Fur family ferric uptake transcriptional regulator
MKKNVKSMLKERSLKATPTRMKVVELISNYGKALPYREISNQLKELDRVTLYRNLLVLEESGIIHKTIPADGETYYALCLETCTTHGHHHQHIHFQCKKCLEVTCVPLVKNLDLEVSDYEVHDFSVEAYGICPKCRDSKN